jgi:8-oxo-dGTP diphosphatase
VLKRVHVAVGVVRNDGGEILIARRPQHLHQGGFWEFPGGKVEAGESVVDALGRELLEELGITIEPKACLPLIEISHDYPDKQVFLDVWWVNAFAGEPEGREGQPLQWVAWQRLSEYEFPAANAEIVTAIEQHSATASLA